jgi:fructose-1-phosphate kinase PfkB-like protein
MQMIHKAKKFQEPDMVILSGSFPPGVHPEIYRKMIAIVKGKGTRVILDSDGDTLRVGTQELPDVIKPNVHELNRPVDSEVKEMDEILSAAGIVREQGSPLSRFPWEPEGFFWWLRKSSIWHRLPM